MPSFWKKFRKLWKQFRKSRSAVAAVIFIGFLSFVAIFAELLANKQPIYCKYEGKGHFPLFSSTKSDSLRDPNTGKWIHFSYAQIDWRTLPLQASIWPLVTYDNTYQDPYNRGRVGPGGEQKLGKDAIPLRFRHWFGTTMNGNDVLAIVLYGSRISLIVGGFSMGIAALIGILLGALAGYFGDRGLKVSRASALTILLGLFLSYFYGFYVRRFVLEEAGSEGFGYLLIQLGFSILISIGIMGIMWGLSRLLKRTSFLQKAVPVPLDKLISRLIEVLRSLPIILVIISFSVVLKGNGSLWFVVMVIGLTGWAGIARLVRAEMLRIVSLNYIEATQALGFSDMKILIRHAIPNGITPALVAITFGIAGAIVAEASLSYLGIGVDPDVLSWGKMFKMGKQHMNAWWLIVFPGVALFLTVLSLNLIGERLRDVLDPRNRGEA